MRLLVALLFAALQAPPGSPAVTIALERTACFGTCPVYTVTITGAGSVRYDGRQFVTVAGVRSWAIDPAAVRALSAEIDKAGFFDMKDEYTQRVTDLPTTFTEVTIGTRHKRIKDYLGAPPALRELERRIEEVSGVLRYVRGDRLEQSLARGDAATVRRLLADGADAKARDADGVTLLMKAALSGDPDTVRAVLAAGGDPTARDLAGRNAADRVRDRLAREPANPKLADILRLLTDE